MVVEDALSRINSIIERKPLEQTADKKHPADTSITFENVSFRYPGAVNDALHDVSLKINAGEQVALSDLPVVERQHLQGLSQDLQMSQRAIY